VDIVIYNTTDKLLKEITIGIIYKYGLFGRKRSFRFR
jgi:hypothetical protein